MCSDTPWRPPGRHFYLTKRQYNYPRPSGACVGASWVALLSGAIAFLALALWNATLAPSEKGFYGMSFALALFAAVAVQKNVRDSAAASPADQPSQI
ncbi:hypothetical protein GTP41_03285 [Pseudoduganella sp. DS3]|uniref:YiaAB two helix domain-containing protein n=1 Tax=Pseudoduganella guangdongensis TaxID=2692179 RepID=A0A6N9HE23_9BURK|nr:hypothetical protein [Pseudoduganella guangdongensis]